MMTKLLISFFRNKTIIVIVLENSTAIRAMSISVAFEWIDSTGQSDKNRCCHYDCKKTDSDRKRSSRTDDAIDAITRTASQKSVQQDSLDGLMLIVSCLNNERRQSLRSAEIKPKNSAVAKRPCDCCLSQFWPNIAGRRYFADIIGLSLTTVT